MPDISLIVQPVETTLVTSPERFNTLVVAEVAPGPKGEDGASGADGAQGVPGPAGTMTANSGVVITNGMTADTISALSISTGVLSFADGSSMTSAVDSTITDDIDALSASVTSLETATASNLSLINSLESATADNASAISSLESATSDLDSHLTGTDSGTASNLSLINSLESATGDIDAHLTGTDSGTASNLAAINSLESATGDIDSQITGLESGTGENAAAITSLESATGDLESALASATALLVPYESASQGVNLGSESITGNEALFTNLLATGITGTTISGTFYGDGANITNLTAVAIGAVPYVGATASVDLAGFNLTAGIGAFQGSPSGDPGLLLSLGRFDEADPTVTGSAYDFLHNDEGAIDVLDLRSNRARTDIQFSRDSVSGTVSAFRFFQDSVNAFITIYEQSGTSSQEIVKLGKEVGFNNVSHFKYALSAGLLYNTPISGGNFATSTASLQSQIDALTAGSDSATINALSASITSLETATASNLSLINSLESATAELDTRVTGVESGTGSNLSFINSLEIATAEIDAHLTGTDSGTASNFAALGSATGLLVPYANATEDVLLGAWSLSADAVSAGTFYGNGSQLSGIAAVTDFLVVQVFS